MRKELLIFVLLLGLAANAQTMKMKDVFKAMPDSLLPYLSQNNRFDFIDFIESNMDAKVTNGLGGLSVMHVLTDNYMRLSLNEASEVQIRLLPVSAPIDSLQQIVCVVHTYGAIGQESVVSFYSCLWRPLDMSIQKIISVNDLMTRPDTMTEERYKEVTEMLKPYLVRAELSADEDCITFQLSEINIPSDDLADVDTVKVLRKLKWRDGKFNKM